MKRCLIIFAKEPKKGKVKTRLLSVLGKEQCVNLYKAFLKDTIYMAKRVNCEEKVIAYQSNSYPSYLRKISGGFKFYRQKGKDIGKRMYDAFKFAECHRFSKTVIIGSDSPTLKPDFIEAAFRLLDTNDIVLGPAIDGGYYLIGLKNPYPGLFKDVEWSSDKVLEVTLKNAGKKGKKVMLLKKWYDVDDRESLLYLKKKLIKDKNTARWTRKIVVDLPHN